MDGQEATMPVTSRKQLRRDLASLYLNELTLGTSQITVNPTSAMNIMDPVLANTDYSGQNLYQRAFIRVGSADYRNGSYNFQSGAFAAGQAVLLVTLGSGADFEINQRWSAPQLDGCIDQVILLQQVEREISFPSVDGQTAYVIDNVASPNTIVDWRQIYYFADPTSTVNRVRKDFPQVDVVQTATGKELRIPQGIGGSQQIVIDALLQLSLPSGDAATINIPDRDWLMWGAAARAWNLLIQGTPGQDASLLKERRAEAARAFTKASQRHQPGMERKITFETPDNVPEGRPPGINPW